MIYAERRGRGEGGEREREGRGRGKGANVSLGSEGEKLGEGLFSEEHESDATNASVMEGEFL